MTLSVRDTLQVRRKPLQNCWNEEILQSSVGIKPSAPVRSARVLRSESSARPHTSPLSDEVGKRQMLTCTLLVGNPKPDSRTLRIARELAEAALEPGTYELSVIDLAKYAEIVFAWPSDEMTVLTEQVAACDLLVVASPTYKATYTGLLKAFMDRYPNKGLQGVVALPVMTGGDMAHSVSLDVHLRPLLVELGARIPTAGLYFDMHNMDRLDEVVHTWAAEHGDALHALLSGSRPAAARAEAPVGVAR